MGDCCLKGFKWEGVPNGKETTFSGNSCYVTGSNHDAAIIVIHDLFGWTWTNTRLLADHYAEEAKATVYVPDFFGGEVLPQEILLDESRWAELNLPAFMQRNSKDIRSPEIIAFVDALKSQLKYQRIGAIGFCFGGWAVFHLGAKDRNLVDCISTAHPTFLTKQEMQNVGVPVQILAPEMDPMFTPELKVFANSTIPTLGVPYDYQYFPGLEHAFAVRGNLKDEKEMRGLVRAKNAAVFWFREWLHAG